MLPVLFVHGINDTGKNFGRMMAAVREAGARAVHAVDLTPNRGEAPIAELAKQVDAAAQALLSESGAGSLNVVGFSMGSLVSRYWLQRLGGKARTRRFISISGPHAGTWLARFSKRPGIVDMRPGSALLKDLEADGDPFGPVEVHVFWTPLDLMILPARSSMLKQAKRHHSIPVVLHPLMLSDKRVIREVVRTLAQD